MPVSSEQALSMASTVQPADQWMDRLFATVIGEAVELNRLGRRVQWHGTLVGKGER